MLTPQHRRWYSLSNTIEEHLIIIVIVFMFPLRSSLLLSFFHSFLTNVENKDTLDFTFFFSFLFSSANWSELSLELHECFSFVCGKRVSRVCLLLKLTYLGGKVSVPRSPGGRDLSFVDAIRWRFVEGWNIWALAGEEAIACSLLHVKHHFELLSLFLNLELKISLNLLVQQTSKFSIATKFQCYM